MCFGCICYDALPSQLVDDLKYDVLGICFCMQYVATTTHQKYLFELNFRVKEMLQQVTRCKIRLDLVVDIFLFVSLLFL